MKLQAAIRKPEATPERTATATDNNKKPDGVTVRRGLKEKGFYKMDFTFEIPVTMGLGLYEMRVTRITGTRTTYNGKKAYKVNAYERGSRLPCYSVVNASNSAKALFNAVKNAIRDAVKQGNVKSRAGEIATLISYMG